MKHLFSLLLFLCSVMMINESKAQTEIQPIFGIGRHKSDHFNFRRYGVAFNNIFKSNDHPFLERIGMYYVLEHAENVNFKQDNSTLYERDILGIRYKLNNKINLIAGVGLFQKGILLPNSNLRKEMGISFTQNHFALELTISDQIGATANIGYVIPLKNFAVVE